MSFLGWLDSLNGSPTVAHFPQTNPSGQRIFGDLQGIGATDWNKVLPNMSTSLLNRVNDITYINQRIKGIDYGVTLYPFHIAG